MNKIIFSLGLILILIGCDRVKYAGAGLIRKTKGKVNDKIDQLHPHFDYRIADTKYNKLRFQEFIGFAPTEDVKGLYASANRIGIDASYHFAFTSDKATVDRIINELQLTQDSTFATLGGFEIPYKWWDAQKIDELEPYTKKEDDIYWYLWYDSENSKTYILTFDI